MRGTHRSTIGRHNEVDELTVRKFFAQYEVVLARGMVEEMSDRPTYTVRAERGTGRARRWVLQCVEVPGALSEVTRLDQADAVIREAIAWVAQVDADSFDVSVVPVIPQTDPTPVSR